MTLRPLVADGNTTVRKSELPEDGAPRGMVPLRTAFIVVSSLVAGMIAGLLTYFPVRSLAEAVVAGVSAQSGTTKLLDTLID